MNEIIIGIQHDKLKVTSSPKAELFTPPDAKMLPLVLFQELVSSTNMGKQVKWELLLRQAFHESIFIKASIYQDDGIAEMASWTWYCDGAFP